MYETWKENLIQLLSELVLEYRNIKRNTENFSTKE